VVLTLEEDLIALYAELQPGFNIISRYEDSVWYDDRYECFQARDIEIAFVWKIENEDEIHTFNLVQNDD
jgi:hypothetical protein